MARLLFFCLNSPNIIVFFRTGLVNSLTRLSHLLHDRQSWFTEASTNCNAVAVTFVFRLKQSKRPEEFPKAVKALNLGGDRDFPSPD
jgi:hypothetical protein